LRRVKLIVGTHNAQSVGATDAQFEEAYQSSYKPYLTALYGHPEIDGVLFYSGTLLGWLEEHHPEFLMLLDEMVKRKQIELLGGGYYDPILSLIPNPDRLGQFELLTTFLRQHFGRRPRGGWITERIWEPTLASTIKNSGMDYIFLEDRTFSTAGFSGSDLYRPCITEDQGKALVVYPVSTSLTRMVPGESPQRVVDHLLSLAGGDEETVAVIFDAGERYGMLDKRGKRLFKDGWFDLFFSIIENKREWIETMLPSRHPEGFGPVKKGYFSSTTYEEMMQWLGDTTFFHDAEHAKSKNGAKGSSQPACGNFRQFLSRYPESNILYAKMLYTHDLVNQMRGDRHRKRAAREELWKGECNNALWHGPNGGIYDSRLRKAAYRALIEAEKVTREKGIFKPSLVTLDFDLDGQEEFLYHGTDLNGYVHLAGGTLFELEYVPAAWNYLDTLARHREPYHAEGAGFVFDRYSRRAFIDHFFLPTESIAAFDRMSYSELGPFIGRTYSPQDVNRDRNELLFTASGNLKVKKHEYTVELSKRYSFKKSSIVVRYTVENASPDPLNVNFGSEINLALESGSPEGTALFSVREERRHSIDLSRVAIDEVGELVVNDLANKVGISLSATAPFKLWSLPVETTSRTLTGTTRAYQSSCFVPQWSLRLGHGEKWEVAITLSFSRL